MQCSVCKAVNRDGRKFCSRCGNALARECRICGIYNEHDARFCGECGSPLLPENRQKYPSSLPKTAPEPSLHDTLTHPERKQITVMFCDLVNSTAMATRLDPEDLRLVIRQYQGVCVDAVRLFDGFVARFMGDGIMVYFGYPRAHEDDAVRAAMAAMKIVENTSKLVVPLSTDENIQIQTRIGIATGLVVVGDLIGVRAAEEEAVIGETPNLAARLQSLASPGTVLVSATTCKLIENRFALADTGEHTLRGFDDKMRIWRIKHESGFRDRLESARQCGRCSLVGRDDELGIILKTWQRVQKSEGCVLLLTGDPGTGKSRLIDTVLEKVDYGKINKRIYQCSPFHRNTPLFPVIVQIETSAGFKHGDTPAVKIHKLERYLSSCSRFSGDIMPLCASLLSLPVSEFFPDFHTTPQEFKDRLFTAIIRQMEWLSGQKPLLIILEDVHWIDPSSMELVNTIIAKIAGKPVLFIVSSRNEFTLPASWKNQNHVKILPVQNLTSLESRSLVYEIMENRPLPDEIISQIVLRSDGMPLFIEELTKAMIDQQAVTGGALEMDSRDNVHFSIPLTLQESLEARLDQNPVAKETAQIAATLGRDFSRDLIFAVCNSEAERLELGLNRLCDSGILVKEKINNSTHYRFRHVLIRDAAYESLLKSRRRELHARIVDILENSYTEITEKQPEILAYHCFRAGMYETAVDYWTAAGFHSMKQCADTETISHVNNGIKLLRHIENRSIRCEKELELQILKGASWRAIKSFASTEVMDSFARAYDLCLETSNNLRLIDAARGLYTSYYVRAEHDSALLEAGKLLARGLEYGNPDIQALGHYMTGASNFWCGNLVIARHELEDALKLYNEETFLKTRLSSQLDFKSIIYNHYSWTLWLLGFPDKALAACKETLRISAKQPQAYTRAMSVFWSAEILWCRGDYTYTENLLRDLHDVTVEHSFGYMSAIANLLDARVCFNHRQFNDGMKKIETAFNEFRYQEAFLGMPWALGIQAQGFLLMQDFIRGTEVLEQALAAVETYNERNWQAELYRLQGEFHMLESNYSPDISMGYFNKSLQTAGRQHALSFELRTLTSMARLYQALNDGEQALACLDSVLPRLREGFNTRDVQSARAIKESLQQQMACTTGAA